MGNELQDDIRNNLPIDEDEWPLLALPKAFAALRTGSYLGEEKIKALETLVDQFTTVSILGDKVGNDVAEKVQEVNTHNYSKLPSPETKIIQPTLLDGKKKSEKLKHLDDI